MKFKDKIALSLIKRIKRKTAGANFEKLGSIKNVGLIYNVDTTTDYFINKVIGYFEENGKSVNSLAFVNQKTIEDFTPTSKLLYICKKDLNFWGLPKTSSMQTFINTPFDYLINLDAKKSMQLQAISAQSKAKTRLGKYFEEYPNCQDFMIKSLAENSEELFNDIKKYIEK